MMRKTLLAAAVSAGFVPLACLAEEVVTTTDGRQIMLRDDGRYQILRQGYPPSPYGGPYPYQQGRYPYRGQYQNPYPYQQQPSPQPWQGQPPQQNAGGGVVDKDARAGEAEETPQGRRSLMDWLFNEEKSSKSRSRK